MPIFTWNPESHTADPVPVTDRRLTEQERAQAYRQERERVMAAEESAIQRRARTAEQRLAEVEAGKAAAPTPEPIAELTSMPSDLPAEVAAALEQKLAAELAAPVEAKPQPKPEQPKATSTAVICPHCALSFGSKGGLASHLRAKHPQA